MFERLKKIHVKIRFHLILPSVYHDIHACIKQEFKGLRAKATPAMKENKSLDMGFLKVEVMWRKNLHVTDVCILRGGELTCQGCEFSLSLKLFFENARRDK